LNTFKKHPKNPKKKHLVVHPEDIQQREVVARSVDEAAPCIAGLLPLRPAVVAGVRGSLGLGVRVRPLGCQGVRVRLLSGPQEITVTGLAKDMGLHMEVCVPPGKIMAK
jgi:hypothetical protein